MAKFLSFSMIFLALSSTALGIYNPFEEGHTDQGDKRSTTGPNKTSNTTVQPVSDRRNPFDGLSLFEQVKMQMKRRREERRKTIFDLVHGKQPFGKVGDSKGPQCSTCTHDNLKECAATATTKQCDSNSECYTIQLTSKDGQNTVQKDCVDKARCESDVCKTIQSSSGGGEYTSCKMECCKGDMCNKMHVPKPLPTPQAPSQLKCQKCVGVNGTDCDSKLEQVQCSEGTMCAAIHVRYKDGRQIVERNCAEAKTCAIGVCNEVNRDGIFPHCNASCCNENLCDAFKGIPATKPPPPKCYQCASTNDTECARNLAIQQCKDGERCYSGGLVVIDGNQSGFKRGCTSMTIEECKTYCERLGNSVKDCSFHCCDGNMCNKPGLPVTSPTPTPGSKSLMCTQCSSGTSEEDCQSRAVQIQCPVGRLCHSSQAIYPAGNKIFAKGCMETSQCNGGACSRHIKDTKCSVKCCNESFCNRMVTAPTKTPINNSNTRALLKMIDAFRLLLEGIENSIRASANDFKAANYKDQLTALMTQLQQHNQQSAAQSPLQKIAKSQLLALRKRADEVLKKL